MRIVSAMEPERQRLTLAGHLSRVEQDLFLLQKCHHTLRSNTSLSPPPRAPRTFLVLCGKEQAGWRTEELGYVGCYISYRRITPWLPGLCAAVSGEFSHPAPLTYRIDRTESGKLDQRESICAVITLCVASRSLEI